MSAARGVVIVGGGLAAQRCAETLRARGFEEPVRIVCGEAEPPYDRPPLSKRVLVEGAGGDPVRLRPADWYAANDVELLLGRPAVGLDVQERRVLLDRDESLAYDRLLIATGSRPRRLPQLEGFENVHHLRTLDDALGLRSQLGEGTRLAVVGAGFIGQEVAASAVGLGAEVCMVEALDLPLAPLLGERVGRWLASTHSEEGVRVELSAGLERAHGNGRVEQLELEDGRRIECDAVVVGVGVAPATAWLRETPLAPDGICTDADGRTSVPDVFAAGDVARPWDPRTGRRLRTEHWDAASRQGVAVARAMLGEPPAAKPPPSFWSDQYGMRIQYVGHAELADDACVSGDPGEREFAVLYRRRGQAVAGLTVNRPRELARMRTLIERGARSEPEEEPR